ncbi:unnamed protein product, partial [Linum tenue]
ETGEQRVTSQSTIPRSPTAVWPKSVRRIVRRQPHLRGQASILIRHCFLLLSYIVGRTEAKESIVFAGLCLQRTAQGFDLSQGRPLSASNCSADTDNPSRA